jgi:transcriptional regulator with XRE-family HTH domain
MARSKERNFGQVIRERRRQLNLTQEEVAHRIKTSSPYVGHLESAKRHPSTKIVTRLAEAARARSPRSLLSRQSARAGAAQPRGGVLARFRLEDFRKNEELRRIHNISIQYLSVVTI